MGKIAVALQQVLARRARDGSRGHPVRRLLGKGDGWIVEDVICAAGPSDRPFEEQHEGISIAVVGAGTFQYRTAQGHDLMTPGSLMLGNHGQFYECGHQHAEGDRCVSFRYRPDFFDQLAADAGVSPSDRRFRIPRLPPLRESSPLFPRIFAGALGDLDVSWEELSLEVGARAVTLGAGISSSGVLPPATEARVTQVVRMIERDPGARFDLGSLAERARLSRFHFLRTFERVTGITPHQFVLRARLREAALRLFEDDQRVIDVALDCGFRDVSNFNHAFRAEFGVNPRAYRSRVRV